MANTKGTNDNQKNIKTKTLLKLYLHEKKFQVGVVAFFASDRIRDITDLAII